MDYIRGISRLYKGNIRLYSPYTGHGKENIPKEIYSVLRVSNGIEETMSHPKTGEQIAINWILYPYERIMEESVLYKNEYGLEGLVFADDGAGNPYVLKSDGKIICYVADDGTEMQEADSLADFYGWQQK